MPPTNPYDAHSDGHTRYGARVPAMVASLRKDPAIPADLQANRWPPVTEARPLVVEAAYAPFNPLRSPHFRGLSNTMSHIKNKFISYVRGVFSEERMQYRDARSRLIWEKGQGLPQRFSLGGEWSSAPLTLGREPAHTEPVSYTHLTLPTICSV